MKPTLSWSEYQQLELIPASVRRTPNLLDRCRSLWQQIMQWCTKSPEIEIWSVCDQAGTVWWNGYNPQTGRSSCGMGILPAQSERARCPSHN